jgi:hypothetical protein
LLWKPMNYIFVISLRTTEHNLTNLTLRMFTMSYYTSVVSLVQWPSLSTILNFRSAWKPLSPVKDSEISRQCLQP